jgi:hypothetical protein
MANIEAYQYHEGIETRYLRHLPTQLNLSNNLSEECLLLRILLGTIDIEHVSSGTLISPNRNLGIIGSPVLSPRSTQVIRSTFPSNEKLDNLFQHLYSTKYTNKAFFKEILNEISAYFYQNNRESDTTAFLHLYRVIEYISYSFPLIYASISRDYYGTFDKLKNYFSESKDELKFFDAFVSSLFQDNTGDNLATLYMSSSNPDVNQNHYNIIRKYLKPEQIDSSTPYSDITTYYKCVFDLTIKLRNRYFHFAMGRQKNIKSTEIVDSDVFFRMVNPIILNWISVIYLEILRESIKQ